MSVKCLLAATLLVLSTMASAKDQENKIMPLQKQKELIERSKDCRDMLVRLYELPDIKPQLASLRSEGVVIRLAKASEKRAVVDWVRQNFSAGWAKECENSFTESRINCFIALKQDKIIGFSTYDATAPGVAGPLGIDQAQRGRGLGKILFIASLHHMKAQGYAYAVIGWVSPKNQVFFQKIVKADIIDRSEPLSGMYKDFVAE